MRRQRNDKQHSNPAFNVLVRFKNGLLPKLKSWMLTEALLIGIQNGKKTAKTKGLEGNFFKNLMLSIDKWNYGPGFADVIRHLPI